MFRPRIIPCLLLKEKGLVKTVQFNEPNYIGDPINAVRIFNDKEADELIFLNIMASKRTGFFKKVKKTQLPFDTISKISKECLMPLTYGGGVRTIEDIRRLFEIGVEKVAVNTYAFENPSFVQEAASIFGSQSIIVSIDAKLTTKGNYEVYINGGTKSTGVDPVSLAIKMESMGAGEIMINSIDRDGLMEGYDLKLINSVSDAVSIPVVACGGAGSLDDFRTTYLNSQASALAAGSIFVYHGRKKAVLISYPSTDDLDDIFSEMVI
jgi:cyclase